MHPRDDETVKEIQEWARYQIFLPRDLSKAFIATFLLGCEGDKEKAKKVLCNYFYARQSIPEIFTGRDPLLKENIQAWKSSCFIPLPNKQRGSRVFLGIPLSSENYSFVAFTKQMFMCFDLLIKNNEWGNGSRILILSYDKLRHENLSSFTLYITGKAAECERNPARIPAFPAQVPLEGKSHLSRLITLPGPNNYAWPPGRSWGLMHSSTPEKWAPHLFKENYLPGKLVAIHHVHIPPFMNKIYERFKPYFMEDEEKRIMFHKDLRSLHKFISPQILPMEFGGRVGPMRDLIDKWWEILKAHRSFFLQEEQKRMKESRVKVPEYQVKGSWPVPRPRAQEPYQFVN